MNRGVAALTVLALIAFPSSAAAHRHRAHIAAHTPSLLTLALTTAEDHAHELWGAVPCEGHFDLELVSMPEGVAGEASWMTPEGFTFGAPTSTWTNCAIRLAASEWTRESIETDWPLLCTVVMHEWGHLTGHSHSDETAPNAPGVVPDTPEQAEVMRSGLGSYSADLKRCRWEP